MKRLYDKQPSGASLVSWYGPDPATFQKIAFLTGHGLLTPGARIADMGCGWGEGSFHLARLNPSVRVVGVDIDPTRIEKARKDYGSLPNLTYCVGDIEQADKVTGAPFDAILNSSVMHHVYSYNRYDEQAVRATIAGQFGAVKEGGLIVIRDFLAQPTNRYVTLSLQDKGSPQSVETYSEADMLVLFAQHARALLDKGERGFAYREIKTDKEGWRRFILPAYWAAEFLWRKDYRRTFFGEVRELYSFWNQQQWTDIANAHGARLLHIGPYSNPWMIENRFKGRVVLQDEFGQNLGFPPTNFAMVMQKVGFGESLYVGERSRVAIGKPYLQARRYLHRVTGEIVDTVARPGGVNDYLPYAVEKGRLTVWAKWGYPRPLINAASRGTADLDGKAHSGHIIEPVALANVGAGADVAATLAQRLGFDDLTGIGIEPALRYDTDWVFSEESSESFFLRCDPKKVQSATVSPALSGFSTSGEVRAYDAQVLLHAAHVGLLPEARLETNLYALMRAQGITPNPWMDGVQALPPVAAVKETTIKAVRESAPRAVFAPVDEPAQNILIDRIVCEDHSARGVLASAEIEVAYAAQGSANRVVLFPLTRGEEGRVYMGVQDADSVAAQRATGNSRILAALQMRLPFDVHSLGAAQDYAAQRLGVSGEALARLGEGSFASIGMSREKFYPFMVYAKPQDLNLPLRFVRLDVLFARAHQLRDAALILGVFRATHALGLWKKGMERLAHQKKGCGNKKSAICSPS